jgi:hypothetical protein
MDRGCGRGQAHSHPHPHRAPRTGCWAIFAVVTHAGARVWEILVERPRALDALLDALEAEYDVTRETLRADVARLLKALAGARLVEWSEP